MTKHLLGVALASALTLAAGGGAEAATAIRISGVATTSTLSTSGSEGSEIASQFGWDGSDEIAFSFVLSSDSYRDATDSYIEWVALEYDVKVNGAAFLSTSPSGNAFLNQQVGSDFESLLVFGENLERRFQISLYTPSLDAVQFPTLALLQAGIPTIAVVGVGRNNANGGYSYADTFGFAVNFSVEPYVASGAPEPTSWALMLLGFGAVGAGLRRSGRRLAVA